jgi:hypothetical protein
MSERPTALERAFHLARSGLPSSIDDIKKTLRLEGYASGQIDGNVLHKQLRALMLAARASRGTAPPDAKAE